ncbi:DUF1553 domain-containing protein [Allorhodopirellula solitaria]|nr:DUF1553 domain-containing protein [Allorhodopirellula solitaria]
MLPHPIRSLRLAATITLVIALPSQLRANDAVDFNRDIRPLLSGNCLVCHGPDEESRAAALRFDTEAGSRADLGGYAAIVPGDADASEIMERLTTDDVDMRMPPEGKGRVFTPDDVELVRRWIDQGADYARHWSYVKPERPSLPQVTDTAWPINAVDRFILAKLEAEGLRPSAEADRLTLARRLALDVTGLPPTWQEASDFANDQRSDAYEIYVDRMLAKPAFGERWASVWLDLARYADSAGYADDPMRTIWAYRDYVIRSLNKNKPFDQFTIEQIAGDLVDHPSDSQQIATAFHRNTMTNNEGGTNDEEFRNVAVVDRVNTTIAVWMGTTMACAQCHTHKYDPITQAEYFQLFDFFNQTQDSDKRDERPVLSIWTDEQRQRREELRGQITSLQKTLSHSTPDVKAAQAKWLGRLNKPATWQPLQPTSATGNVSATEKAAENETDVSLAVDDEGWITIASDLAPADAPSYEQVTVAYEIETTLVGLKLETPAGRPDRSASDLQVIWTPAQPSSVDARYVRIDLPGERKMIHLAEVQVFSDGLNIAEKATATQSSTGFGGKAQYAIDGNTDGQFSSKSVTHTTVENDPWLELDLGSVQPIESLALWNRTDGGEPFLQRLAGFEISLLDENRDVVWRQTPPAVPSPHAQYDLAGAISLQLTGHDRGRMFVPDAMEERSEGVLTIQMTWPDAKPPRLRWSMTPDAQVAQWAGIPADIERVIRKPAHDRTQSEQAEIAEYYRSITPLLADARSELAECQSDLDAIQPNTSVPVMRELPAAKHRVTHVQLRGSYLSTGDEVSAGVPAALHDLEIADGSQPDRMTLARWLVDDDNPLTPRVIANRHWEQIFGKGLVETSEDFGSQGELPSHPKLLDYLAVELREGGWDLKQLLRLLVTSATYRQSSQTTPELVELDPDNRLLARGPRFRASAEVVRDQALFVSGLLSGKMYGPPVQPAQPDLGLRAAFGSGTDWKTSSGEDRYRRGLYTLWRRSSPYPSMAQFDSPNREVCTVRRTRTNTPLQALVTLNDPVYIEAAQALARRAVEAAEDPRSRIIFSFQRVLLRSPSDAEIDRLSEFVDETIAYYQDHAEDAVAMATEPLGPLSDGLAQKSSPAELAAWTVLSNVILNLDETLMKP